MLSLVPYVPPIARDATSCVCGVSRCLFEEALCPPCRRAAVENHGDRLARLLTEISFDHRDIHLTWSDAGVSPEAFNPRVSFTAPDVTAPGHNEVQFRWFHYWADDMLVAACAAGADDDTVLELAVAQAHYAVATLAIHEVGEWFTFHGEQVFPPHRPDHDLPSDEENGPDGNGAVVLWFSYDRQNRTARTPGTVAAPADGWERYLADIETLPGQRLHADSSGIAVAGPGDLPATRFSWTEATGESANGLQDDRSRVLHAVHQGIVSSELSVVARHLLVRGQPVLAPAPGSKGSGLPWRFHLTYDG
ncbi:hypothetical protein [Streptomyces californicus]|uniref:hypothetical protein n=1 Tax=Streptomyces californicus TaxID=67351 RepID=UPI00296FF492|nr:hypothetical protein [Streptomyces californicus]MDW4912556.1 hypothetical protein [Streptomyces californicus]